MKKKTIIKIAIGFFSCVLVASAGYVAYRQYFEPAAKEAKYEDIRNDYEKGNMTFQNRTDNSSESDDSSNADNYSTDNEDEFKSTDSSIANDENQGNIANDYVPTEPETYTYEYEDRVIGWISIPGTSINYPVLYLQGNNDYYLTHDYTNRYDSYGSIYLDGHQYVDTKNMTLFGHNINTYYRSMFRELTNYENQNFLNNHPTVNFDIGSGSSEWEVIGTMIINIDKDTYSYNRCNFADDADFVDFVNNLLEKCTTKKSGVAIQGDDQLLTLSTCSYHYKNGRTVVICRRVK